MGGNWEPVVREGWSFDDIMSRMDEWVPDYQSAGIAAFRGADLTSAQLAEVFKECGKHNHFVASGSFDDFSDDPDFATVEGHGDFNAGAQLYFDTHHATKGANQHNGWSAVCPDVPVAIQWHIENSHRLWPQTAAGWTVPFKTCAKSEGRTGFVDAQTVFEKIPADIQEILLTIPTIIEYPSAFPNRFDDMNDLLPSQEFTDLMREECSEMWEWATDANGYTCEVRPAAIPHSVTGIPVLRTMPYSVRQCALLEKDDAAWTEARKHIRREFHNPANLVWWEWDTTDFLMVDLFRMAHGVSAFPGGTRTLRGIFGYDPSVDWDNYSSIAPSIASPYEGYPKPGERAVPQEYPKDGKGKGKGTGATGPEYHQSISIEEQAKPRPRPPAGNMDVEYGQ